MDYLLNKLLSALGFLTVIIQSALSTSTPLPPTIAETATTTIGTNAETPTSMIIATSSTPFYKTPQTKLGTTRLVPRPAVRQSLDPQPDLPGSPPAQTTKTCLSGQTIPMGEYCTKVCPDGEVVIDTLACRSQIVQEQQQENLKQITQAKINHNNQINDQIKTLRRQILDIETQYLADKAAAEQRPIMMEIVKKEVDALRSASNDKIAAIYIKIQQLQLQLED